MFIGDNCSETIVCAKVEKFDTLHLEGMIGEHDGAFRDG